MLWNINHQRVSSVFQLQDWYTMFSLCFFKRAHGSGNHRSNSDNWTILYRLVFEGCDDSKQKHLPHRAKLSLRSFNIKRKWDMKIFKVLLSFPDVSYVLVTGWIIHKTDTRDQDTKKCWDYIESSYFYGAGFKTVRKGRCGTAGIPVNIFLKGIWKTKLLRHCAWLVKQ